MALRLGVDARCLLAQTPRGEGLSLLYLYEAIAATRPAWTLHFYTNVAQIEAVRSVERFGGQVHALDLPGYRFQSWSRLALPWMVRKDKLDIFHHFSSMAAGRVPCTSIGTVHDMIPLLADLGTYSATFRVGLTRLLRSAKAIVTPSSSTLADLARLLPGESAPARRFSIAPWGISLPVVQATTSGSGLLLFGGSAPRKNTQLGLEAFAASAYAAQGGRLDVIGIDRPDFLQQLRDDARRLGIEQQVTLQAYVPDEQRLAALRSTRALLFPSSYEGFGLPVLEALACGKPVICSPVSSIPEVAGPAAHYFTVGDKQAMAAAIDAVMLDAQHYSTLQQQCQSQAARFSWSATAQHYIDVIETVHVQSS